MKLLSKLFLAVFLSIVATSVAQESPSPLWNAYKEHEWFTVIDLAEGTPAPPFFKAAIACMLDQPKSCVEEMSRIGSAAESADEAHEAHSILAGVYLRRGEYQCAMKEVEAALRLRPNDPDAQGALAFLRVASTFPQQRTISNRPGRVSWVHPEKSLTLPLSINGKHAEYLIDTGANVSTLSDAEADRLGLEVHDSNIIVSGSTGTGASFRVATAKSLRIAGMELANVAFLVSPASQPPFNESPESEQGIIGLPVLLAAGHIRWNTHHLLLNPRGGPSHPRISNLVFDGADLITQGFFQGHEVSLFIDSGSDWSVMYPRFTDRYKEYLSMKGVKTTKRLEGFGGESKVKGWHLSELPITIGARKEVLRDIDSLAEFTDQHSHNYDGCVGADALMTRRTIDLDFNRMKLSIE